MIENTSDLSNGSAIDSEICIIGAGAVGIALALRLSGRGSQILLVEGGGERETRANHQLLEGEVVDPALHSPTDQYRHRVLGGATVTWGGRCVPLDPIDFETRSWIPESGWPITYDEVSGYYVDAMRLLEAGDCEFSADMAVPGGMKATVKGFSPTHFVSDGIERFSCPTHFGRRYRDALAAAKDVRVLLGANCTELVTSKDGASVESAVIQTLSGIKVEIKARTFVLAVGGLEVPRLLLASRRHNSAGIGNTRNLVGRYYMCHISGVSGLVRFNCDPADVYNGYENSVDSVYCRRRFRLRESVQRELRLNNLVFRLHHPPIANPDHGIGILSLIFLAKPFVSYEYAKRLHGPQKLTMALLLRHALNILMHPFGTALFLWNWFLKRTLALRKFPSLIVPARGNVYSLEVHSEQIPNPESQVSLSEKTDRFGMPQLRVDWKYCRGDIDTILNAMELFRADLVASGKGDMVFNREDVARDMLRDGAFGGHHIGTTRMAADPDHGVVDRDCRVFGVKNLYIASSSVFPTSGQANPTLAIVALALRLADHLLEAKTLTAAEAVAS